MSALTKHLFELLYDRFNLNGYASVKFLDLMKVYRT